MKNDNFTILTHGKAELHHIYKILTILSTPKNAAFYVNRTGRKKSSNTEDTVNINALHS